MGSRWSVWASFTCLGSKYNHVSADWELESTWDEGCLEAVCESEANVGDRFFKTMASFAYNIPVIGPYLAKGLQAAGDKAGANERAHKDLPV